MVRRARDSRGIRILRQPHPIHAFPDPRLAAVWKPRGAYAAGLRADTGLYASGRSALYWALRALARRHSTAWFPAFHCGVEVQAALDAGLEVNFYRVSGDLSVDIEDLEKRVAVRPGPVVVIHYFGFPQPAIVDLADWCRARGVPLVEDCAHALFSRCGVQPLGSFSDAAIFSLRKTLPVLEGGVLAGPAGPRGGWPPAAWRLYAKYAIRSAVGERAAAWYRRCRWGETDASGSTPVPPSLERDCYEDRISWISARLAGSTDPDAVAAARRENWSVLNRELASHDGYHAVFDELPDGTCPLFLPVWVAQRAEAMQALAAAGIETFLFGAFAHPLLDTARFPETERFRNEILCLPVHQGLNAGDMKRIARAFGPALVHPLQRTVLGVTNSRAPGA